MVTVTVGREFMSIRVRLGAHLVEELCVWNETHLQNRQLGRGECFQLSQIYIFLIFLFH